MTNKKTMWLLLPLIWLPLFATPVKAAEVTSQGTVSFVEGSKESEHLDDSNHSGKPGEGYPGESDVWLPESNHGTGKPPTIVLPNQDSQEVKLPQTGEASSQNLLWLGNIVLTIGIIFIARRYRLANKSK